MQELPKVSDLSRIVEAVRTFHGRRAAHALIDAQTRVELEEAEIERAHNRLKEKKEYAAKMAAEFAEVIEAKLRQEPAV